MKIKIGDYVNIEGVSKEVFDACVSVAVASGFESAFYSLEPIYLFIGDSEHPDGATRSSSNKYNEFKNKLTIEQWLFSLAPDWAVDIKLDDGDFVYTDNLDSFTCIQVGCEDLKSNSKHVATRGKTIYTRSQPKWEPKVGEEALLKVRGGTNIPAQFELVTINYLGNKYIVATNENGKEYSRKLAHVEIKEPKPTPEEELRALIVKLFDEAHNSGYLAKDYLAKEIIKAGYKK